MAKALVLSEETLAKPLEQPRAAQQPRAQVEPLPLPKAEKPPKAKKEPVVPLQIRIPAPAAKAIKHAALEADQTISEFMLACFNGSMKK